MKIGIRKPSLKKSLRARTTSALKRKAKSAINPLYGRKGIGLVTHPKRSIRNRIYKRVTIDPLKKIRP